MTVPPHAASPTPPELEADGVHDLNLSDKPAPHTVQFVNTREGLLPLLFVQIDGSGALLKEQAAYVRALNSRALKPSKLHKSASSIGRLWDWVALKECGVEITPETLPGILTRFIVARLEGTVDRERLDPTGLNWKAAKSSTVEGDLRELNEFSDFVSKHFGYLPLNPSVPPLHYSENCVAHREFSAKTSNDFLSHLDRSRKKKKGYLVKIKSHPKNKTGSGGSFPLDRIPDLIAKEKSISKKMIYIELAFGGPRLSEALHHFVTDVLPGIARKQLFPNDRSSDMPLIVLADPEESTYLDTLNMRSENRRQFLKRKYGLQPRTALAIKGDPLAAGWKGMLYDNGERQISQVYWSNPDWAKRYEILYHKLLEIRKSVPKSIRESHPYLYIIDNPQLKEFGQPLKIKNIEEAFKRASKRIGLMPNTSKISPHGLRHAYKKQLNVLKLNPQYIQTCMHHKSSESQTDYATPSPAEINNAIILHKEKI